MPTFYSSQYNNAYVNKPSAKIGNGEFNGKVHIAYFEYTAAAVSNGDNIKLAKIPQGARVLGLEMAIPDQGTAGVINVGWSAGAGGLEAADADGFLVSVNVNSAAQIITIAEQSGAAVPGYLKKFSEEVDLEIAVANAWDVPAGVIRGLISYVVA